VDAILGGGVPRGSITEVAGAASTGKTSFGLSAIAAITQSGAACAWVDVSDALSPESAAAADIVLKRLLWLRMSAERKERVSDRPWSRLEQALKATDLLLSSRRLRGYRARHERRTSSAHHAYSVGGVVSLPARGRASPHSSHLPYASPLRQQLRGAGTTLRTF